MAQNPGAKKAGGARKAAGAKKAGAAKPADVPRQIVDAALRLAAERGWRDLSLAEIAAAAGLRLSEVYPVFSSKQAILAAFTRRIDAEVLAGEEPGGLEGSARDRLFDVLMRRFDALAPYRPAVANILYDLGRDPLMGLCAAARFRRSIACMLEAAELSTSGLRGAARVKALGVIYLATLRVWLRDDSPDMARTMAALDRHLRRAERLAGYCSQARKKGVEPTAAAA